MDFEPLTKPLAVKSYAHGLLEVTTNTPPGGGLTQTGVGCCGSSRGTVPSSGRHLNGVLCHMTRMIKLKVIPLGLSWYGVWDRIVKDGNSLRNLLWAGIMCVLEHG